MDDPQTRARMRADWNARAGEDANYYVAFGRREQDEDEFFATGADVARDLESQLPRLRGREAALEIGCGPGRLLRPMSRHFAEIHGVDVSDEMVRIATARLRDTPNATAHHGSGSGLEMFADERFDFVYSYAVFQHIPSREVVFHYLCEAHRVLKPGGVLRCQLNGLPPHAREPLAGRHYATGAEACFNDLVTRSHRNTGQYDTWSGVRVTPGEIAAFAREQGFQLLALEQIWTQYMWITCRKRDAGRTAGSWLFSMKPLSTKIRHITNAITGEAAAPVAGPMASLSLWIEDLPGECDLNAIAIGADGRACRPIYIGEPAHDGVTQVNAALPAGLRTGLVPIELFGNGEALCAAAWMRMVPAGPAAPRVVSISDGVNLLSGSVVASGIVKAVLVEIGRPEEFRAAVDGRAVTGVESFCVDPLFERYEFNFPLPEGCGRGSHVVQVAVGRREFAPVAIEVA